MTIQFDPRLQLCHEGESLLTIARDQLPKDAAGSGHVVAEGIGFLDILFYYSKARYLPQTPDFATVGFRVRLPASGDPLPLLEPTSVELSVNSRIFFGQAVEHYSGVFDTSFLGRLLLSRVAAVIAWWRVRNLARKALLSHANRARVAMAIVKLAVEQGQPQLADRLAPAALPQSDASTPMSEWAKEQL